MINNQYSVFCSYEYELTLNLLGKNRKKWNHGIYLEFSKPYNITMINNMLYMFYTDEMDYKLR